MYTPTLLTSQRIYTMQNNYEDYIQQNRQLLVDAARAKDVIWTIQDLSDISQPQLLLDMMADKFLNAIKTELFTLQDVKNTYNGFYDFYMAYNSEHLNTQEVLEGVIRNNDRYILDGTGLANVKAEQETCLFFSQLTSESYLNALRAGKYDMSDVSENARYFGPKAVYLINPDFLTAFDELRITMDDVTQMSCDELSTAISENTYPHDSSYAYN